MRFVIDELTKSLRYHVRQLDDNLNKIERSEESIAMLKEKNLDHHKAIEEIEFYLDQLEKTDQAAT
jgi:oligoribonuclease NrnB/cAMP/cGMP phosphodiesterase (DHH superfamily)